mmetsp:Transcript_7704/g.15480  ORF Transcript_7704/g.15480 Transcript_7704/m.15480 type:complete len:224 (-) Transcript_7704:7789-8460(-)
MEGARPPIQHDAVCAREAKESGCLDGILHGQMLGSLLVIELALSAVTRIVLSPVDQHDQMAIIDIETAELCRFETGQAPPGTVIEKAPPRGALLRVGSPQIILPLSSARNLSAPLNSLEGTAGTALVTELLHNLQARLPWLASVLATPVFPPWVGNVPEALGRRRPRRRIRRQPRQEHLGTEVPASARALLQRIESLKRQKLKPGIRQDHDIASTCNSFIEGL